MNAARSRSRECRWALVASLLGAAAAAGASEARLEPRACVAVLERAEVFQRSGIEASTRLLLDETTCPLRPQVALLQVQASDFLDFPPHRHPRTSEWAWVVDGEAQLWGADGSWTRVKPHTGVLLPPGAPHAWQWRGNRAEPAVLWFVYSPPEPARTFRGVHQPGVTVPTSGRPSSLPRPRLLRYGREQLLAGGRATWTPFEAPPGELYVAGRLRGWTGTALTPVDTGTAWELWLITAGRAQLEVDGARFELTPGMAAYVPPHRKRTLRGLSSQPFEALGWTSTQRLDQRLRPHRPGDSTFRVLEATPEG